jgi:uncharacterized LabA/DUF88 family protein
METTSRDPRLAVLIDADNVPFHNIREMLEEIAKYGTPTFKRIYADWTKPTVAGWKTVLLENAISPVQQYSYTSGKNATDSAMIIDAMDILYTGRVDGFCIVSSDSDFTRLATRLREAGMIVFGLGEKKTPISFISACNKFIYLEILKEMRPAGKPLAKPSVGSAALAASSMPAASAGSPSSTATKQKAKAPVQEQRTGNSRQNDMSRKTGNSSQTEITKQAEIARQAETARQAEASRQAEVNRQAENSRQEETIQKIDDELIKLISDSINDLAGEDGWAFLGELGNFLLRKKPDFDPRNYGFRKLVPMIKSIGQFEIDERNTGRNSSVLAYARTK